MKKEKIKITIVRILLVASLVAILLIAVLRGINNPQANSQPKNLCDGCKNKENCENVQPVEDTISCAKDTVCIKSIKK